MTRSLARAVCPRAQSKQGLAAIVAAPAATRLVHAGAAAAREPRAMYRQSHAPGLLPCLACRSDAGKVYNSRFGAARLAFGRSRRARGSHETHRRLL